MNHNDCTSKKVKEKTIIIQTLIFLFLTIILCTVCLIWFHVTQHKVNQIHNKKQISCQLFTS